MSEKKYRFYEKKIEWLRENCQNSLKKTKQLNDEKSAVYSEGNRSVLSNGNKKYVTSKDDLGEIFILDKLNKRIDKIKDFQYKLTNIRHSYDHSHTKPTLSVSSEAKPSK